MNCTYFQNKFYSQDTFFCLVELNNKNLLVNLNVTQNIQILLFLEEFVGGVRLQPRTEFIKQATFSGESYPLPRNKTACIIL